MVHIRSCCVQSVKKKLTKVMTIGTLEWVRNHSGDKTAFSY